jgi:mono/diheme cytochrome c family protein
VALVASVAEADTPASNFATHCASCHGADRLGGSGPALLPENLERLRKPAAADTIAKGRMATQMPGFADKLSVTEIDGLVAYVYTPPPVTPGWGERQIAASRVEHVKPGSLGN